jgi:hypothetical protein
MSLDNNLAVERQQLSVGRRKRAVAQWQQPVTWRLLHYMVVHYDPSRPGRVDGRIFRMDEQQQPSLEWNLQRTLSKINCRIHTDAMKEEIIPKSVTKAQAASVYASEADLLHVALFGKTAVQWRAENSSTRPGVNIALDRVLV